MGTFLEEFAEHFGEFAEVYGAVVTLSGRDRDDMTVTAVSLGPIQTEEIDTEHGREKRITRVLTVTAEDVPLIDVYQTCTLDDETTWSIENAPDYQDAAMTTVKLIRKAKVDATRRYRP